MPGLKLKGNIHIASTASLTRIITYLSEVNDEACITKISNACFGSNSGGNKSIHAALQWLISNKIILKRKGAGISRWPTINYYSINPKFKELRES